MKIAIIGAGAVGSACLTAAVMRGIASEIVVVDRTPERAVGLVTDTQYGAPLFSPVVVRAGAYAEMKGSELVVVTVGLNEKTGGATNRDDPEGRLRLLDKNVEIFKDVVSRIREFAPQALVLVVTDPPDPLADAVRMMGHERVLSTGTYLDSLRFRFHLARRLGVSPSSVDAQVLGEHGTSEVFVWSTVRVGGVAIADVHAGRSGGTFEAFRGEVEKDVKFANISIIEGIGASQHGIGMVTARIAEIILRDEAAVLPIGCYNPKYGVTLSLPSIVGRDGVRQILEPALTADERQRLQRSADALKAAGARMKI